MRRLVLDEREDSSREASYYINKSLTFLEQVVVALADSKGEHLPRGSSKLTHLLKDSPGGSSNSQATLVACVWPQQSHHHQIMYTLRFAARMGLVTFAEETRVATTTTTKSGATQSSLHDQQLMSKLENEVYRLRQELARRPGVTSPSAKHCLTPRLCRTRMISPRCGQMLMRFSRIPRENLVLAVSRNSELSTPRSTTCCKDEETSM